MTSSVTDGSQTATLSTALQIATVGVSGWSTWNSPPATESATPRVLARYSTLATLTITLSAPTTTFGFELEPNSFGAFPITADFLNGSTSLGTVTQSVNGNSGALLFAASTTTPITSVVITATGGGNGYAIGQFRYAAVAPPGVPVPGTLILSGVGILVLAGLGLLARRRTALA